MQPPSHPETHDGDPHRPSTPTNWATVIGVTVFVVLLAVAVILHLSGAVGPGAHG